MSKIWRDLSDVEKLAHNAAVADAAMAMHAASAEARVARTYLTPGGFPESWKKDSFFVAAQRADAAYEAAFQAHNRLLHQYSA